MVVVHLLCKAWFSFGSRLLGQSSFGWWLGTVVTVTRACCLPGLGSCSVLLLLFTDRRLDRQTDGYRYIDIPHPCIS